MELKIQNFGPIKKAQINFGDLTFLIGPQASGKSLSLELLKLIIENIAGIECHSLKVQNPELNSQHVEDKDMILDIRVMNENGEICDVEMQNSSLDREQYQRCRGEAILLCVFYSNDRGKKCRGRNAGTEE